MKRTYHQFPALESNHNILQLTIRVQQFPQSAHHYSNHPILFLTRSQSLPPRPTLRIEKRPLPNPNNPMPLPFPQPIIIRRRSMINTPIIPNRQIPLPPPPKPNLKIVILNHEPRKPLQQRRRLLSRDLVDFLHVVAHCED